MTLGISSAFDGGNIRVAGARPDGFDLEVAADAQSDFYQWFSFRLTGAAEQPVTLRITNCAGSAYPNGWPDYRACMSADRDDWLRVPTTYEDGVLTIRATPPTDSVWFAYFAPYTMERHHDLIATPLQRAAQHLLVVAPAIHVRGVEMIDALVDGMTDQIL